MNPVVGGILLFGISMVGASLLARLLAWQLGLDEDRLDEPVFRYSEMRLCRPFLKPGLVAIVLAMLLYFIVER